MTKTLCVSCVGLLLLSVSCSSSESNGGGKAGATSSAGSNSQSGSGTDNTAGHSSSAGHSSTGGRNAMGDAGAGGTAESTAGGENAGGTSSGGASGGSAGSAGSVSTSGSSVTERGGDAARTGHWVAPTLTKANVMSKMALDTAFKAQFSGEFAGSPLFLAGATPGSGRFFVATTQNDVYALDETTGAVVWTHKIGDYLSAQYCGDPKNHGIVGTPVIDAAAHKIFLAAGMADGHHEIHALSTDDGKPIAGWPIDVSKIKAGSLSFPSTVQNQRSALSLVDGVVYVGFGGYCGDGGPYHGWVIGVKGSDPTQIGAWATMDEKAGIWAAGGFASDGNGVFAVTSNNGASGNHDTSDSEEILRITGLGVGHRDSANMFFPTEWAAPMNSKDLDFGSCSPTVVSVPGAKPSKIVVAPAKPGRVYFLDAANLGGSLGQFADMAIADTNAQSVYTTPTAYTTGTGVHVALSAATGAQCPNGTADDQLMSILLKPSAADQPPMPSKVWCAPLVSDDAAKRAPISTNSADTADPIVWHMNGVNLNAFDGETGATLYDSSKGASPSSCAGVHRFTTLIQVNGRIVAGGNSGDQAHLCSWSVH